MSDEITSAVLDGNTYDIDEIIQAQLDFGVSAETCLQAMIRGIEMSGDRFECGEYFLPELTMAADTFKRGMVVLEPHLAGTERVYKGIVVLGTVQGDVHDIGKNLVGFMLESAGFKVIDLGIDVPAERFIGAVVEQRADVLAMSALLTTTMLGMTDVVAALERGGLRDRVKVIIGGAPVSKKFAEDIGADGYASSAPQGVEKIKTWVQG
jgi:5-methyltetrahydrofolate--homocysteine methyltransferase